MPGADRDPRSPAAFVAHLETQHHRFLTPLMRILHFTESGDTSGYFPNLARWHDRTRFRMHFGTLRPNDPGLDRLMADLDIPTFTCGAHGRGGYPRAVLRLARYLRQNRIAVLHAHLFDPSIVGLLAAAVAGTRVRVLTRHYSDYHTRIHKAWHVRLDRLCNRLAHRVIAVSQHTAAHLVAEEGAPPGKVETILNGVDFERLLPAPPDACAEARRELGAEDAWLLVVPARLHPEKGHGVLFRALPGLCRRLARPLVVALAGQGPFEAAYRQELALLDCSDAVRFLGFRRDLPRLIQAADAVVLPSVAEAFGLVLVESLYLGTPVVSTTAGGIPEIVDDGIDGVLVPPGDTQALEDALATLLGDPPAVQRLAGAGRTKVETRFRFETMVRSYERVYEGLLASVPATSRA
jgi:glycosyltransferase involved in cell wall biosynthesis